MSEITFMGYRCTFHVRPEAKIHREHNIRDPKLIKYEKHIDTTKYSETTLDLGTLDDAYKQIFGDALVAYNKGKRKDRQISNYLDVIRKDNRKGKHKNQKADGSRKAAYEAYITIGNRDNQPNGEDALRILKLFVEKWIPSHYKQIKPICISYHADEFSLDAKTGERIYSAPHCHFDYVYIADGLTPEEQKKEKIYRKNQKKLMMEQCEREGKVFDEKAWLKKDWQEDLVKRTGKSLSTGLTLQSSMSGSLAQMGFKTGRGQHTAQIQFEEQVRHDLENFAEEFGLKIDRTPGVKHDHAEKNVYQQKKDNERKEEELVQREAAVQFDEKKINYAYESLEQQSEDIKANRENMKKEEREFEIKKKEHNNKEAELSYVERQLINKDNELRNKEYYLSQRNSNLIEKEKLLEHKENKLEFDNAQLDSKARLIEYYDNIAKDIFQNNMTINKVVDEFEKTKDKKSFRQRFNHLVKSINNYMNAISLELKKYVRAFKKLWKFTPNHFRELANTMEKEHCETYEQFHNKRIKEYLASDKDVLQEAENKYIAKKNRIDRDYKGMCR